MADKGYHSDEVLTRVEEHRVRSHIAEPERGRRVWKGKNKEAEQRRLGDYCLSAPLHSAERQ